MTNITLKQLRYFEALVQHGHFGRAAAASSVSQPALSVQIRELEDQLGVVLFERRPRQVRLTGFGEQFSVRASAILRSVDELSDLARSARDRLVGRLRLGVIPTIAPYLLPTLLGRLAEMHLGLDIHVRETLTPRLLRELSDGQIDCAILALPVDDPALREVDLFSEAMVLVRHSDQENAPMPSADQLRETRLLLLEDGHCFRDQALSFCNLGAARPREGLDGSSLSTLVQMVGAGIGVTLIPEMAVPVETRSASVSLARFAPPEPGRTVGMVWRKTNPLSDQLMEIADVVRDCAESLRDARQDSTQT
ncbi:MAG: LysR substrate-binding domain-containing protein [Aestuariivita sp.]|uniref:LysR substrate-binding domain-containing protein n=1 Tax=Aestuariivita sp. TaxID=1872407 RepID=UPI003BAF7E05